jgi:hypothetical protein
MAIDLEKRSKKSAKVVASSTNIPTGFTTASTASLVLTGIAYATHLAIVNATTTALAFNYSQGSTSSAPTEVEGYIPAGASGGFSALALDDIQVSSTVYIKADGSAISSGTVYVFIW